MPVFSGLGECYQLLVRAIELCLRRRLAGRDSRNETREIITKALLFAKDVISDDRGTH